MEILKTLNNFDSSELQELKEHLDRQDIKSSKVKNWIGSLNEEELTKLKTPITARSVSSDPPASGGRIQMGPLRIPFKLFWLHADVKIETYYVYTKYTYLGYTTVDREGNTPFVVDKIELSIQREVGSVSYSKSKTNTSKFEFIDEVYGINLNTGGKSKLIAKASNVSVGINFEVSVEVKIE